MTQTTTPTTSDVLDSMLKESTGRHFLDSGGAYGRNWERNQGREFEAEPETTLSFDGGYIEFTHSTYHFLKGCLEFDPETDAEFSEFCELPENQDEGWMALMEAFAEAKAGPHHYNTVNTYNGEDALSQTIQYTRWANDDTDWCYGEHVLLQIHGGCDVRGGYTRPRAFVIDDNWGHELWDNARGYITCEGPTPPQAEVLPGIPGPDLTPHNWMTDDTCHWYEDGGSGGLQLEDCEIVIRPTPRTGEISVVDGVGHCPRCASPLRGSF